MALFDGVQSDIVKITVCVSYPTTRKGIAMKGIIVNKKPSDIADTLLCFFVTLLGLLFLFGCVPPKEVKPTERDAKWYFVRGTAMVKAHQYDQAINYFSKALKVNPRHEIAYALRGWCWAKKGDCDRAISDFNEVLQINSRHEKAYAFRGLCWAKKGDYDRAISDFNRILKTGPIWKIRNKFAWIYTARGFAWAKKGDYNQAIADYNMAIEIDPRDAHAYLKRGLAYEKKGQHNKSSADFAKAIEINPELAKSLKGRGNANLSKGKQEPGCTTSPAKPEFVHSDLSPAQQKSFKQYLDPIVFPHFKAFAIEIGGDGAGWSQGYHKPEHAIETAMKWCGRKGADCRLYAVGERVVTNYSQEQLSKFLREYYEEVLPPGDLRSIKKRALTGDEIKTLISGREGECVGRTGNKFTVKFMASGRLLVRIVETKTSTKPGNYRGKWWIEGDRWCRKLDNLFSGRTECQYFIKDGDGIAVYNENGAFINRIRFTKPLGAAHDQ